MDIQINFDGVDLMFEITRFCNMQCPHCVRGDSQRMRIKKDYINEAISKVGYVYTLMLTGGEPALAVDLINYTRESFRMHGKTYGNFWMATNGTVTSLSFFDALTKAYDNAEENDSSGLRVSIDGYHDKIDVYPFQEFIENIGYDKNYEVYLEEAGAPEPEFLIYDGRAAMNYPATRSVKHNIHLFQDGRIEGTIYINAKGYIISTCDISYETMDNDEEFIIGHVTGDWEEMFANFFENHPELIYK
jgi:organic radical activating enzyme